MKAKVLSLLCGLVMLLSTQAWGFERIAFSFDPDNVGANVQAGTNHDVSTLIPGRDIGPRGLGCRCRRPERVGLVAWGGQGAGMLSARWRTRSQVRHEVDHNVLARPGHHATGPLDHWAAGRQRGT